MLTVADVACRLKCSLALVYALCSEGKLPHHRLGLGRGTIRISEEQFAEFLQAAKVEHPCSAELPLKHLTMPDSRRERSPVADAGDRVAR